MERRDNAKKILINEQAIQKKGKFSLIKSAISLTLVAGTLITAWATYKKKTDTSALDELDNVRGRTSVFTLYNTDVKENEFVILDSGNYRDRKAFLDRKMKYCNENDISLGIVINTDATVPYEIYDDLEYAKTLITKYNIDFPVYLKIDDIMENPDLNISQKSDLIKAFLEKAEKNNIDTGIYGLDSNICDLNTYGFDLNNYKVYLKKESDKIVFEGKCTLIEDLDGIIQNCEIQNEDDQKNLYNKEECFVEDAYYVVCFDDDINEIAMRFGLSVTDILKYNNLSIEEIKEGTILRIPNNCQEIQKEFEKNISKKAITKGVDLSYCQKDVNWDTLKENVDFAILKASEKSKEDPLFSSHYENCKNCDIPVGIYYITRATTVEEIRKEAYDLVELLRYKDIDYPVYIDFENNPNNKYENDIWEKAKESGIKEMLEEWNKIIKDSGYLTGIYCNKSTYKSLYDLTDSKNNNFLDEFEKWIAGSDSYSDSCDFRQITDPGCKTDYQGLEIECNMRQVSEACKGIGAGNHNGCVDFNYCYTDYELKEVGYKYSFDIKGLNDKNVKEIIANIGVALAGAIVVISGPTLHIILKKRKKKRRKDNRNRNIRL